MFDMRLPEYQLLIIIRRPILILCYSNISFSVLTLLQQY